LATRAAAQRRGPVYLRLSRYETPVWRDAGSPFEIGKAEVRRPGGDITLAACGVILGRVLEAAEALEREGISAEVLNVHTVKPLDVEIVLGSCERTGAVVTIEEHSIIGGLGSAVAEVLAERASKRIPLQRIGVRDTFGESGTAEELLEKHGLTVESIARAARELVQEKN
jgi:transketolase